MSDYDLKVHPFSPGIVVSQDSQGKWKTTDTCVTAREVPSHLYKLLAEQSTDVLNAISGTPPIQDRNDHKPLGLQIGGKHYKAMKIQPVEYIHANQIPFIEGSIIKYLSRWRDKGGVQDLQKAKHFIDLLIELENNAK